MRWKQLGRTVVISIACISGISGHAVGEDGAAYPLVFDPNTRWSVRLHCTFVDAKNADVRRTEMVTYEATLSFGEARVDPRGQRTLRASFNDAVLHVGQSALGRIDPDKQRQIWRREFDKAVFTLKVDKNNRLIDELPPPRSTPLDLVRFSIAPRMPEEQLICGQTWRLGDGDTKRTHNPTMGVYDGPVTDAKQQVYRFRLVGHSDRATYTQRFDYDPETHQVVSASAVRTAAMSYSNEDEPGVWHDHDRLWICKIKRIAPQTSQ